MDSDTCCVNASHECLHSKADAEVHHISAHVGAIGAPATWKAQCLGVICLLNNYNDSQMSHLIALHAFLYSPAALKKVCNIFIFRIFKKIKNE